jgi:hypothetical protein
LLSLLSTLIPSCFIGGDVELIFDSRLFPDRNSDSVDSAVTGSALKSETMAHSSIEILDLETTLERALERASPGLHRAAVELGANAVAVFLAEGSQVEITYRWNSGSTQSQAISHPLQDLSVALQKQSGPVDAGTPLAQLLRQSIWEHSLTFLLFPWRLRRRVVTVVFGFAAAHIHRQVPDAIVETLNLIGLATWSVKEIARLRAELKTVNGRLAGRKLVERAKGILQADRGISEEQAYEYMRSASRRRRITLAELAEEVLRTRAARDPASLSVA